MHTLDQQLQQVVVARAVGRDRQLLREFTRLAGLLCGIA
jgi:hypothetical protein